MAANAELERRGIVRAWCLYDWANSAFATTIVAAVLPPYFAAVASRSMAPNVTTAAWGYASAAALLVSAVTGAILGAMSDRLPRRKPLFLALVVIGALATVTMALVPAGSWRTLLVLFAVAFIPYASANVLYDSFLPSVARPGEIHRVSARGFAYGYAGGGLLLAINLAWILMPQRFGLRDIDAATRLSIASVGVWWLLFSIPFFRHVPEPHAVDAAPPNVRAAFAATARTLARLHEQPELLRFLIAYWLYSDGIGTIIRMATIYGNEIGIGRTHLVGSLLLVQFIAAPASLAFGRLAHRIGARAAIILGLMGYVGLTSFAYFISKPWHFWVMAGLVALFQGGTQALSRSLFASLVPPRRMGELFGFYSVSEKVAGIIGPFVFGLVAQAGGTGRYAVFTLLPFFIGGAWLLATVDLERGARRASGAA